MALPTLDEINDATKLLKALKTAISKISNEIGGLEGKVKVAVEEGAFKPQFVGDDAHWELVLEDWRWKDSMYPTLTPPNAPELATVTAANKVELSAARDKNAPGFLVQKWVSKYGSKLNPGIKRNQGGYNTTTKDNTRFEVGSKRSEVWWYVFEINKKRQTLHNFRVRQAEYEAIIERGAARFDLQNADGTLSLVDITGFKYNVGSVKEAYFTSRSGFIKELTTWQKSNSPSAITNASQLWVDGNANKGMIQPWMRKSYQNTLSKKDAINLIGDTSDGTVGNSQKLTTSVSAFQFLYNPASIDLTYSGWLGQDPNMQKAGVDEFNVAGAPNTQSTISFNILINRMFDMKYYDKTTKKLLPQYAKLDKLYYPRMPDANEQEDIFTKGTMYDVEYLLRAILGYGYKSYFSQRNAKVDGLTSDMGYISAGPVEIHLGYSLRYLGLVSQVNVSHVLFDERMVPIFTNVGVSIGRIADPIAPSEGT